MSGKRQNWLKTYPNKIVEAAQAVQKIRRGQRVFIGSGAAEPQELVRALTARGSELIDTEIIHLLTLGAAPYAEPGFKNIFRHNALFVGANVRAAVAEGRADYTPVFLSEIPQLFKNNRIHLDVALIQVSEPDAHGFCSYGVSVDVVKAAAESADIIIAEVNPSMPRTLGDSFIHVDRIDYMVRHASPLPESLPGEPDAIAREIGRNIADLIEDGSTLQMGIGSIPNAVLQSLGDKHDLGIHTEMFSDGVIDLIDSGVINGAKKSFLPGKVVSSFCMGSQRLYEYVDNNPAFEFRPVEFTNDPFTISRNDKMVAINAALEIDLTGQVCADSIGYGFYSGIGGQVDFIRGAARSRGGKPIIALRSTARGGSVSRIVPHLKEGAGVVTTRGDVHYVVTEYGIADLWGKNVRERALALISIAHPKFRNELLEKAKKNHLVYADQILLSTAEYPRHLETTMITEKGDEVDFRPIRPTDEPLMKEMFYSLDEDSVYQRFFLGLKSMPHAKLQEFANVDYETNMCIVGIVQNGQTEKMVAVADYHRDSASGMADAAFLVRDEFQGHGIGTFMIRYMTGIAKRYGITGFTADVLAENRMMMRILNKTGHRLKKSISSGIVHYELDFSQRDLPLAEENEAQTTAGVQAT